MSEQNYTEYIIQRISDICQKYKRREGGSESSRAAGLDMAEEARKYADTVDVSEFKMNPRAFMASIPLYTAGILLSTILAVVAYAVNIPWMYFLCNVLIVASFGMVIAEYIFYREFLDPLCKKRKGLNVFAVRKAKGETKRRIIICGHKDAAYEMPVMMKFNVKLLYGIIGCALLCPIIGLMLNNIMLLDFLPTVIHRTFIILEVVFSLVIVPLLWFVDFRTIVDGANDNLTGCFIGMSILKEMADTDFRFDNTDVCCLITDGEEAGLRGATAFAKENISMLMDKNTMVVIADTIHEMDELRIYSRGINYTESNSAEACDLLYFSALKHGLDLPYAEFYPGANDSEAFSREGVKSAAICGVRHTPAPYYHTKQDTYTNLNPECISTVRAIVKTAVEIFDGAGKAF